MEKHYTPEEVQEIFRRADEVLASLRESVFSGLPFLHSETESEQETAIEQQYQSKAERSLRSPALYSGEIPASFTIIQE